MPSAINEDVLAVKVYVQRTMARPDIFTAILKDFYTNLDSIRLNPEWL